ncbi:MAG: IS30 family transposase [Solirubrobacteraceae bacterium]
MTENTEPKYTRVSADERDEIARMHAVGQGVRAIARALGRAPGTISAELRRNSTTPARSEGVASPHRAAGAVYHSHAANELARKRASRTRETLKNAWLREYVEARLRLGWTPERIAGRLSSDHPGDWQRNVSHETIYRWIWSDDAPQDLRTLLPRRRLARGKVDGRGRQKFKIPARIGIEERPAAVDSRAEAGHFEGDTVIGKQGRPAVHTEVERATRYMIARIIPSKSADDTLAAMLAIFGEIPPELRKTLTLDNGTEFARHLGLHELITTYFARPYHSWERGSNENINGYLRRYFPKGTDFGEVTQEQLDRVVELINNMPRRCLNWRTAAEAWATLNEKHNTTSGCLAR